MMYLVEIGCNFYCVCFQSAVTNICQATNKQLFQLVEWAKHIPHFTSLPLPDQVLLLRAGNISLRTHSKSSKQFLVVTKVMELNGLELKLRFIFGGQVIMPTIKNIQ